MSCFLLLLLLFSLFGNNSIDRALFGLGAGQKREEYHPGFVCYVRHLVEKKEKERERERESSDRGAVFES